MPERWTRVVLRFRVVVIAAWLVILGLGAWSAAQLPPLLANSLAVPGTDSERARTILRESLRESDDGVFTVVFPGAAADGRRARHASSGGWPSGPRATHGPSRESCETEARSSRTSRRR